jgi:hypothetical protein
MTNIYNLFKFIEDKEGKKPDAGKAFKLKLAYAPEELRPEDLNIEGDLSLTTAGTALPKNLHINGAFYLTANNMETLPEGLQVGGKFKITAPNLEKLPDDLKAQELVLSGTKVRTLPKSLKIDKIDITEEKNITPSGIPENLHKTIVWNRGTFADFESYTNIPATTIPGFSKPVKGRKVELKTLEDLPNFEKIATSLPELLNVLKKQPIENLELYKAFETGYATEIRVIVVAAIKLPELPLPLVYIYREWDPTGGDIKYKGKKLSIGTFNTDLKSRGLEVALGRLIPGYQTDQIPKYLQNDKGKLLRLSQIIDRDQKPVSMDLGTKKRGGLGVEGKYEDYALAFSQDAQSNLAALAKKLGVKWGDFVAYRFGGDGDANYVIKGEGPDGKVYYVNRYGSGQGGSVKLYNKEFKQV